MKSKAASKVNGRVADSFSTTNRAAYSPRYDSLSMGCEKTFFLTSLLGTQLLLPMSPPDYPIIKATVVVPAEIS